MTIPPRGWPNAGMTIRIGCGAGFAGDRLAPAQDLVERGALDYLVLECLAERTIALAQLDKARDPDSGYDSLLGKRMRRLLGPLLESGTRLVTNMGAANPMAAARRVQAIAHELGLSTDVAVVIGDDVLDRIDPRAASWEDGIALADHGELISANAYLGADGVRAALETGARVVVTGRVGDASLFLGPVAHSFGWDLANPQLAAAGTVVGHLLECAAQVTGGYFADPPRKPVPDLAGVGYPVAEVASDGSCVVTKLPGTGGRVDFHTVAEQLTYEVADPSGYITADVVVDMTTIELEEVGPDRVAVRRATGRRAPDRLKVSTGYRAGWRCEAEISYAGTGAAARARLAADVVRARLDGRLPGCRLDLIGVSALHGDAPRRPEPYECRLRVAASAPTREDVEPAAEEVLALLTSGPAGGAGVRTRVEEVIGILSSSIPRGEVQPDVVYLPAD